jgi:hypothetical protein
MARRSVTIVADCAAVNTELLLYAQELRRGRRNIFMYKRDILSACDC